MEAHGGSNPSWGFQVLRRIAYTLLALYRAVTLRSDEGRAIRWRALLQSVRDANGTGRPWPPHGPTSGQDHPPENPEGDVTLRSPHRSIRCDALRSRKKTAYSRWNLGAASTTSVDGRTGWINHAIQG